MKRQFFLFFLSVLSLGVSNCATVEKKPSISLEEVFSLEVEKAYKKNLVNGELTPLFKTNIPIAIYPTPAIPRYYRYEMFKNLKEYSNKKDEIYLGRFKYWFNKWKKNFPNEYQTSLDQMYGYSEYQVAIKKKKWNRSRNWEKEYDLKKEAGVLGYYAGKTLDALKSPNWEIRVKKGPSALEVLSTYYKEKKEPTDHKMQNKIFNGSIKFMETLDTDGQMDLAVSKLANPKAIRRVTSLPQIDPSVKKYKVFFNFATIKDVILLKTKDSVVIQSGHNPCVNNKPSQIIHLDEKELTSNLKIKTVKGGRWICD